METLAARAYMSRRTFDRRFRSLTGSAPLQWLITQRVLQAQRLLETSDYSVDEVAGRCGFRSPVALRGHFRRQLGSSPAAYRAAYRARRPQGEQPATADDGPHGVAGAAPRVAGARPGATPGRGARPRRAPWRPSASRLRGARQARAVRDGPPAGPAQRAVRRPARAARSRTWSPGAGPGRAAARAVG